MSAAPVGRSGVPSLRHLLVGTGWVAGMTLATRICAVVSVPLILHQLGSPLYAVWVVTGALFMAQGLVDLGMSAAVVRYVSAAAADDAGAVTRAVILRALGFYTALSVLIGVPVVLLAGPLASAFPHVPAGQHGAATALIRYAAVAFAITNLTVVLTSALQGMNLVASAYRSLTIGWVVYLPVILVGFSAGLGADAVGLAWVSCFTVQLVLQAPQTVAAVRRVGDRPGAVPGWGEMLSLGGRWQISMWADFATFQLPRLLGAGLLSSAQLVSLDVAMRAGQLVVSPLFAFFPMVVPSVARIRAAGGNAGVKRWLDPLYARGAIVITLVTAACVPLIAPLLALWTGRPARDFALLVTTPILLGVVAHASTGLLSSTLLARGEIRPVLWMKWPQFLIAAGLLVPAALVGVEAVALVLALALIGPALVFNLRMARRLGLEHPLAAAGGAPLVAAMVALVTLPTVPIALLAHSGDIAPWLAVLTGGFLAVACLAGARAIFQRTAASQLVAGRDGAVG